MQYGHASLCWASPVVCLQTQGEMLHQQKDFNLFDHAECFIPEVWRGAHEISRVRLHFRGRMVQVGGVQQVGAEAPGELEAGRRCCLAGMLPSKPGAGG